MTLIEAVGLLDKKYYKAIRRSGWGNVRARLYLDRYGHLTEVGNPHEGALLSAEDILATDWEVYHE